MRVIHGGILLDEYRRAQGAGGVRIWNILFCFSNQRVDLISAIQNKQKESYRTLSFSHYCGKQQFKNWNVWSKKKNNQVHWVFLRKCWGKKEIKSIPDMFLFLDLQQDFHLSSHSTERDEWHVIVASYATKVQMVLYVTSTFGNTYMAPCLFSQHPHQPTTSLFFFAHQSYFDRPPAPARHHVHSCLDLTPHRSIQASLLLPKVGLVNQFEHFEFFKAGNYLAGVPPIWQKSHERKSAL